jgi:hypothetical protein
LLIEARHQVVTALAHGRRTSYLTAETITVTASPGQRGLAVLRADETLEHHTLPGGSRITGAPARGHIRFFASGFAENGTIRVALDSAKDVAVVINQRGDIR